MYFTLLLVGFALFSAYLYLTRNYDYWKRQNVPCASLPLPGIGHALPVLLILENMGMWAHRMYLKMGKSSMFGCFFMQTPALVIRDPELVKQVLNTDFTSFSNNKTSLNPDLDHIMKRNPFFAKDEEWKDTRYAVSNNFTAKTLRCISDIVLGVCDKLVPFVQNRIDLDKGYAELELKRLITRVTGEVIANAGFGIEGYSFEEKPPSGTFASFAHKFFEASTLNGFERVVRFTFPGFARMIGMRLMDAETDRYFRNIIREVLKSRSEKKVDNSDFLKFIVERMSEVDEDATVAQVSVIFFDGYETSSSVISSIIFQLAEHPDLQEKARQEVLEVIEKSGGKLNYDCIKSMEYMDKVMHEAIRVNPAAIEFIRVCNKQTTLKGADGIKAVLEPGSLVVVSSVGLHADEEYWPNPTVFDPERFAGGKDNWNKYAFLPFGEGPRKCVGKRLGIMLVKLVTATLLTNFKVEKSPRTKLPLKLNPNSFTWVADGGLWVRFKPLHS
ncbi:hypothetical protein QAD02_018602 [Eretmocerus hayati]|uniref:Uncharacterized protein n=1 Tax=Eretmocerus hayati TaxID=131215 RepID=A0ACC2PGV3_9HYME|nr:hypothetical protein QAD02_018602 [Eretmocerus hayati]